MAELHVQCTIDGRDYSYEQLARIQYERQLHVLHEMKRLGATIKQADKALSDDEINLLRTDEARAVCIAAREAYDPAGIKALFKTQLQESDLLWKDRAQGFSDGDPMPLAVTDLAVHGFALEDLRKMNSDLDAMKANGAAMNPEHYFVSTWERGIHGMEAFGMYGGPTEVKVVVDPSIQAPLVRDPSYPIVTTGYTILASDETPIHIIPFHQYKPIEGGIAVKLAVFFPTRTHQEIVDGHKIHLAIEFWEAFRLAAGEAQPF
jgi:hypothetical protein